MVMAIHESFLQELTPRKKSFSRSSGRGLITKSSRAFLERERSLSQQRLTDLTRLAKSTISVHLATLLESGVVRTKAGEGRKIFELTDRAKIETMLDQYPHVLSKATHRFIDLWDF